MKDQVSHSKESHASYNNKSYWKGAFDASHPDTARHYDMLKHGLRLIEHLGPSTLLSIGDNLGRDAGFFKSAIPDCFCTASDLCTSGIGQAETDGFVDVVCDVDVEGIPYEDSSIDVVVAKEAFHHWPRPMLGLYEMLRVAKKAVLLIEPNDVFCGTGLKGAPFSSSYNDEYEEVGNYKYQVSLREILKCAWALYLPMCAASGFNDPYKSPFNIDEWKEQKEVLDRLGAEGSRQFNLLAIAIYKQPFSQSALEGREGIHVYTRPLNPFLANDSL